MCRNAPYPRPDRRRGSTAHPSRDPRQNGSGQTAGDGALGFWKAIDEVFPGTRHQRCWVHKTANVRGLSSAALVAPLGRLNTKSHSRDCVIGEVASLSAVGRRVVHPRARAAVDGHETLGPTKKSIDVDNIIAQSNHAASDAAYMRSAAKTALLAGEIGAGAGLLGGIGQGLSGLGGGAPPSMPKGYNPNSLSGILSEQKKAPLSQGKVIEITREHGRTQN